MIEEPPPAARTRVLSWSDPAAIQEQLARRSGLEFLQGVVSGQWGAPPMADLMGLRLVEVARGRVVFEAEPAEFHYNLSGVVHGGFAATMLDSALGCCVTSTLGAGENCTTLELKINYIRAITIGSGTLRAIATVLHIGRRTAVVEGRITDAEGRLYAHASSTYLVMRP